MNTLKRKYNCENVIIAGDLSCGVSLERLVSRINEDGSVQHPAGDHHSFRKPGGTSLTRSISMVTAQPSHYGQVS